MQHIDLRNLHVKWSLKLPDLEGNSNGLTVFHKTLRYQVSWKSLNNSTKLFETVVITGSKLFENN
jgi:hypothetical protein